MLQNMLDKPEHHRIRIAYLATFVIGVFVFSAWIMIAGFNVKQAMNTLHEEDKKVARDFRSTLPSLRQEDSVTTELVKSQEENSPEEQTPAPEQESKPFWKRIFEN